jgi:CHAD domain-containing protein/CYTH domain-containing protein
VSTDIRSLLTEPTPRAARAVALALLDNLDAEYARLAKPTDVEALHDFRVALRRLRSWLRAYRRDVRDSVGKKVMLRLGALARATTDSRDIEVHLEWLAALRATLKPADRAGVRWLERRLSADKRRADAAFRESLGAEFAQVSAKLRKNLSRYAVAVWDQSPDDRWALTAATLIQEAFLAFRRKLSAIEDIRDDDELHRARIAGKRLRYLTEPLTDVMENAPAAIASLKTGQDLLGSVHDAHVFARTLRRLQRSVPAPSPRARTDLRVGLRTLTARLNGRRTASWRSFSGGWQEREFEGLSSNVHAIVLALRELGGSGVEIERKYLLKKLPPEARKAPVSEIEQGYLPGSVLIERVRRVKSADGVRYLRTVKTGGGLVRTELEEPCTYPVYKTMWPLTKGKRIRKRRYRLADAGHVWEIDEFLDRRLVLAEIELTSARDQVVIPEWLARCVSREVTGEPAYLNHTLSR